MSAPQSKAKNGSAQPLEDYGFFGPNSPTWRVWTYPTALTVGFQRSVVVEELDPFLLAAVNSRRGIYTNPKLRYDRTIKYFATVAIGDSRTAIQASEFLMKVHAKAVGIEPVSGKRFDANDPASQLWIHLTGWHSVLKAYEMYGPGRLSPVDEARYWEECAIAAELQTCDPADVPRTREGVRQYFEAMRPRLAASELTQSTMQYLLDASAVIIDEKTATALHPVFKSLAHVMRAATIATMPKYMRELAGIYQSPAVDFAVVAPMRAMMRVLATRHGTMALVDVMTPSTRPIIEPKVRRIKPLNPITLTPTEARAKYGTQTPKELHQRILDGQPT